MYPQLPLVLASLSAVISTVSAHGVVTNLFIDSSNYPGNIPNGATNPSIIRQINDPSPVKGAMNPNINCGPGAGPASIVGKASPGGTIKFHWTGADLSNWPHNTGSMNTHMSSCGDDSCDNFDSTTAKWFKIQEIGRTAPGQPWAQAALMTGATADITLPKNIVPGSYLIRHEIIALHIANTLGGAEFYPSCAQIQIDGSGTGAPLDSELVSFPGAYSDSDPGIFTQSAFDVNAPYVFPGVPIAAFVNGGAPGKGNSSAKATGTKGAKSPASTTASGTDSSAGSCKLVRKANVAAVHRPRRLSRIMRGINAHGSMH